MIGRLLCWMGQHDWLLQLVGVQTGIGRCRRCHLSYMDWWLHQ